MKAFSPFLLTVLILCNPFDLLAQWVEVKSGLGGLWDLYTNGNYVFAATGGDVLRSTNNGASWASANSGITNLSPVSLCYSGGNLFVGTAGGVFRSPNDLLPSRPDPTDLAYKGHFPASPFAHQ